VRQTVGPLVEGQTPKQIEALRVLDPACGSGSFLLGAFDFLLGWYLDYYTRHEPEGWAKKKTPPIYETAPNALGIGQGTKNWQLTTTERKRILTAHLYGVDIDAQAVEVTKLSLLLKVLEGEARELRGKQLDFHRVLPDLGANIKCGNSLIGSDFYSQPDLPAFDDEARYQLNAFDWEIEFAGIMKSGGFDAVIGNPPYGATLSTEETQYCVAHYPKAARFPDSYCLFMIRVAEIVNRNGRLSLIVPNTFCDLETCDSFRRWIMTDLSIERIWQSGWAFDQAVVDTLVCVAEKSRPTSAHSVTIELLTHRYKRRLAEFFENDLLKIDYRNSSEARSFVRRISSVSRPFGNFATMNTPRRKQRGITERGFAPMAAGGSHHRGKPRSIGAVQNKGWSEDV
jgi:hypothetical protein